MSGVFQNGSTPTFRFRAGWLRGALCGFLLWSSLALALDARKTAEALAARAAKAFESGNMTEAASLYREAYRIDAAEPAYLYGAARAAHTARDLEHAEADYVAFLALPNGDPARIQKAKTFLESLRSERSEQKAVEAKSAEALGDSLLAATLYLEAWRMAPGRPEPLLKAAILERQLGDKKAAAGHLQQYLQLATAGATGRGTAEALLQQLGGASQPVSPPMAAAAPVAKPVELSAVERPKPEPVVVRPTTPEATTVAALSPSAANSSRRAGGWTALGLGGAAVIAGGILAILAVSQQSSLDANRLANGHFDGDRISVTQAANDQANINGKWTGSLIAGGVGVAAIGIGVWLLATDHTSVAILPRPDGLSLAGRF